MSKRRRTILKQQKEKERQKVRAAKAKKQLNLPSKWEEKKRRKRQGQVAYKEGKFPGINKDCYLEPFQIPSSKNCNGCVMVCPYNK